MNTDKHRLLWASRRGMLELDLILLPFLEHHYDQLDDEDKQEYQRLLTCEDQDLFAWFMKKSRPEDPVFARMVDLINATNRPPGC